jgi:spore coat protein H
MKKFYFLAVSLILSFQLFSQNAVFPENGTIYDGKLHQILLTMTPENAINLYSEAERWTDRKFPASFTYDGTSTLENVGIRIKGNTSRNLYKQSIKIGTDEFIKQEFQGLKTFNLNSTSISTPQLLNSSIDVSTLKKGIYLIKIKTSEEVIIDKLIKN